MCVCKCVVLVIHHVKRMRLIILLSVASAGLNHIFPHYLLKSTIFGKKLDMKCVLIFSAVCECRQGWRRVIFRGNVNWTYRAQDMIRCQKTSVVKVMKYLILCHSCPPFFWTLLLISSTFVVDCFMLLFPNNNNNNNNNNKLPQKLALISPTGGGRSVGMVRSRTKSHGV